MNEEDPLAIINELVLELSLASSLPIPSKGRSYIRAAAAAFSLANRVSTFPKKDLGAFEYTIPPLLTLLKSDIENPIASKAALGLRTLIISVVCMDRFLADDGLNIIARVLDILLVKRATELNKPTEVRGVVENLAICYREIVRFHQWKVVRAGAIRHCVLLLKLGDVPLKTISCTTLAYLSTDLEICKQLFAYGAIKPILNVTDSDVTNEPCMLAGLGCIIQLCRIPEIGLRMFQQGALPVLEKGLNTLTGHGNLAIREKSLYSISLLGKIDSLKSRLSSPAVLTGVKREFLHGTMEAKLSVLHLLMSLHLKYSEERSVVLHIREAVMHLMKTGPWTARNLCVKVVCVLYTQDEDRMYFVQQGLLDALLGIVANKSKDLQEAPIVCYLYLCVHPDIPKIMLEKGIGKMVAELLYCEEPIIKELAVIVLKALNLYDGDAVDAVVPEDKKYLMKKDPYNPHLYGSEYGGMIQEYLQTIVENRRENKYLLDSFTDEEVQAMGLTEDQLKLYENTFMELDADCGGSLDLDELKMLMVLMGEEMDADELQEVLDQYDTDKSGELDFKEFVVMMQGWSTRFGTGITKLFNTTTKRGAIGRARRDYDRWWNRNKIEAVQVADARNQKVVKMNLGEELKLRYLPHEELLLRRERETRMREMGISYSRNYSNRIVYHGPAGDYKFKKSKRGLRVILPPMGYQRSVSSVPNTPTSRISDGTF